MKHIYGFILFAWLGIEIIMKTGVDQFAIASLLGALCIFIIKEKFYDNIYADLIFLLFVLLLCKFNSFFIILSGVVILDLSYYKKYKLLALISLLSLYYCIFYSDYNNIFFLISSGLFGYIIGIKDSNEERHMALLDGERQLRYNLELTQNELIKSKREIEQLTEVRERSRIAQEIHDNIGHSIAGVIFQLEAAHRVMDKDLDKSKTMIKLSNAKLREALELTRNTVYNIKPNKSTGIAQLEKIIREFTFCKIDLIVEGDLNKVSALNTNIMQSNIKEALTNAFKYSKATVIELQVDIGEKNIRLKYKDNGVGCENINEGMGISGMKNRIRNVGGTIAIDGKTGFLIVCNLPVAWRDSEEERVF